MDQQLKNRLRAVFNRKNSPEDVRRDMGCLQNSGEVVKTPRADMPAGSGTGEDIERLLKFWSSPNAHNIPSQSSRVSASSRKTVNSIDLKI